MDLGIDIIDLYLTGKCNLECGYCYGEEDTRSHMTKETIDACIKFSEEIGIKTVELCGGEPLLSPHFEYSVKEIKRRGWNIILRTNGMFLDQHMDLVAENCEWVGISIDGLDEVNASMRPSKHNISVEEQFRKPIESIYTLKSKNKDIKILLASVASNQNYKSLVDFKDYIIDYDLPINKWKIYQFVVDKFRSVKNSDTFKLTRDQFNQVIKDVPPVLPNGATVIHQRSDIEGAGGNCLLVYQSGKIKILENEYGTIGKDSTETIYNNLISSDVIKHIRQNKGATYNGK